MSDYSENLFLGGQIIIDSGNSLALNRAKPLPELVLADPFAETYVSSGSTQWGKQSMVMEGQ